jgi:hypothetical protein
MPEADPSDTPLHVGKEEWLRRSASRQEITARHDARQYHRDRVAPESPEPVELPTVRWPQPPERAFLTACETLTWIGWGEARPKERAAELEAGLFATWGVSGHLFGRLIQAFETGESQEGLDCTPDQARDRINRRERATHTFAELAERLKSDRAKLRCAFELLEASSDALVKACVDGALLAKGRQGNGPDRTIPEDVFAQMGVTVTWWDTIEAGCIAAWTDARFRYSDVLRLWPARPELPAEPAPSSRDSILVQPSEPEMVSVPAEPGPKHTGGRPQKYDWAAFDREMIRLANTPDGLPDRPALMRHMMDWCSTTWGADKVPAESVIRDHIAKLYP